MNLVIEDFYGKDYRIENISDDTPWQELVDQFENLGLAMGYSPSIKDNEDGHYEYVLNEEENEKPNSLSTD